MQQHGRLRVVARLDDQEFATEARAGRWPADADGLGEARRVRQCTTVDVGKRAEEFGTVDRTHLAGSGKVHTFDLGLLLGLAGEDVAVTVHQSNAADDLAANEPAECHVDAAQAAILVGPGTFQRCAELGPHREPQRVGPGRRQAPGAGDTRTPDQFQITAVGQGADTAQRDDPLKCQGARLFSVTRRQMTKRRVDQPAQ